MNMTIEIKTDLQMGWKAKDKITGMSGIIIAFTTYNTGCDQVLLSLPLDKDGKWQEGRWFDIQRIERVGDEQIILDNDTSPGFGPPAPIK